MREHFIDLQETTEEGMARLSAILPLKLKVKVIMEINRTRKMTCQ